MVETQAALAPEAIFGGRYRLVGRLGAGGMGEVFRAEDTSTGQVVALKLMGQARDENDRLRFRREFHTLKGLRHPNIVRVFDFGIDGEQAYYTMELLGGRDLRECEGLSVVDICSVVRDIASALALLHARRLVHRDVKPHNVRVADDGSATLIDFGILTTVGPPQELAGTAPYVPPESFHCLPLDGRVDIYSLGALAYRLLAGHHAYPAQSMDVLPKLWAERPAPPSAAVPDLPAGLDDLILSMLAQDRLARPASAAEVIEKLSAIVELPDRPEREDQHSYLSSAALVGRDREMRFLSTMVEGLAHGRGGAVIVEAPSGTGKSRLLDELGLYGQLAGATIVKVESRAGSGLYGVARGLAKGLLAACPQEARKALEPFAGQLGRVIPEVKTVLGTVTLAPAAEDPGEERSRAQRALADWFLATAEARALVIVVDDIQRADEVSAAVLAAMANRAASLPVLLALGLRTDEACRAEAAVNAFKRFAQRVRLRGLDLAEVEALVTALFGVIEGAAPLAAWMHKTAGGSPLYTTELARQLVEDGTLQYRGGEWVIDGMRTPSASGQLADTLDARIAALPARAREIGQAVSVLGGSFDLRMCVTMAGQRAEADVFDAIDVLVTSDILMASERGYRLRHDGFREALLRSISDEMRRDLHRRAADALRPDGKTPDDRKEEVGWHLLRGGRELEGAALLEAAGRELHAAQSFRDAIGPLDAALEVYERLDGSPRVALELRWLLVLCGALHDLDAVLRYADESLERAWRYAGMAVAARIAPLVGRTVGFFVGLGVASVRWLFTRPSRRGPGPIASLSLSFSFFTVITSLYSHTFYLPELRRLIERMRQLAVLRGRLPEGAYRLCRAFLNVCIGLHESNKRDVTAALRTLETDRSTPMSEVDRLTAMALCENMVASSMAFAQDPAFFHQNERVKSRRVPTFAVGCAVEEAILHRLRGDESRAQEVLASVEDLKLRLGSPWTWDSMLAWQSSLAYAYTGDTLALRRTIEQMRDRVAIGFRLDHYLELALGEYGRLRGELEEALAALQRAERLDPGNLAQNIDTARAEILLAQGDLDGAERAARRGLEAASDPDSGLLAYRARAYQVLALVAARSGAPERGLAVVDVALREAEPWQSPSILGRLHEAAAVIASDIGDAERFRDHLAALEKVYGGTKNAILVRRLDRLRGQRRRVVAGGEADGMAETAVHTGPEQSLAQRLARARGPTERYAVVLGLAVESSAAAGGYLFVMRAGQLELVAPASGYGPPADIERRLMEALAGGRDEVSVTTNGGEWMLAVLANEQGCVGALALEGAGRGPIALGTALRRAMTEQLVRSGDAEETAVTTCD